jgi:predicted dehydrogenase
MYNVAVIGAGGLGGVHVANYAGMADCRIAVVYDPVRPKAEVMAAEYGAEVADDAGRAFADDIDVVLIATPTNFHADYCIRAAQAGKAIFCEKPMTRTLEQGEAVIEAVRAAGVTMMVGHVLRWFPEYGTARAMALGGSLGKVGMVRATRINTMPRGQDDWFGRFDWSGGVILDMSIHDLDWLAWTFGPVERVRAQCRGDLMPLLDYGLVSLRFASGVIAHVEGSWADTGAFRTSFEIAGSEGLLSHDSTANVTFTFQKRQQEGGAAGVQRPSAPWTKSPYLLEDEHFVECLNTGAQPMVTVEDAFEAVRLGLACLDSSATGKVVRLA